MRFATYLAQLALLCLLVGAFLVLHWRAVR